MSVRDRVSDSVVAQATSGDDIHIGLWDFDKSVASSRMERHYLIQYHRQALFLHSQSRENATPWSSTSTSSTPLSLYSQDFDSRPSTALTSCSSFDTNSAPRWKLRKIKTSPEARSAPPPRSFARDLQFSTHAQKSPLPTNSAHHWTNAIFQVGGTPCVGFQFDSLSNETPLEFKFLWAGSPAKKMQKSPIPDFCVLRLVLPKRSLWSSNRARS